MSAPNTADVELDMLRELFHAENKAKVQDHGMYIAWPALALSSELTTKKFAQWALMCLCAWGNWTCFVLVSSPN